MLKERSGVRQGIWFCKRLGDFVVDEMCICGHYKSQHGSSTKKVNKKLLRAAGHGNCCQNYCPCQKFTFERWVTAEEKADYIIATRSA